MWCGSHRDAVAPQTVVVPQRGIWGTAGVNGMNIDKAIDNEGEYLRIESEAERLDDVVKENAALLKVPRPTPRRLSSDGPVST